MMKNFYITLTLCCLIAFGCKKQVDAPTAPVSEFYLGDPSLSSYIVREATTIVPLNNSKDAVSYLWDLGNGTTSTETSPSIYFGKAGTYSVSLTVKSADGSTSTSTRDIKVLSPVVQNIKVKGLTEWIGAEFSTLKRFKGGDVWVEIYKVDNAGEYNQLSNGAYDYPLHFKSPVLKNVSDVVSQPLNIEIPGSVNLSGKLSQNVNFRYIFTLFVKDAEGTHMLFNSDFIGSSFMPYGSDLDFNWTSGFNNASVIISCKYQ